MKQTKKQNKGNKLSEKTKYIITAIIMSILAIAFFITIAVLTEGKGVI